MYAVIVNEASSANIGRISRYFQTKRAAIKWAKWCVSNPSMTSMAQVWNQVGGILVAEFHNKA